MKCLRFGPILPTGSTKDDEREAVVGLRTLAPPKAKGIAERSVDPPMPSLPLGSYLSKASPRDGNRRGHGPRSTTSMSILTVSGGEPR